MNPISKIFSRVASIILDIDDTQQPREQIAALNDFLTKNKISTETNSMNEFLQLLKKKHLVDSITISTSGELIASSEGNGIGESFASAALIEFIGKQIARPETVLVKMKGNWFMVFPYQEKIYIIKAGTSLSTIELRALAKEIEEFIKKENAEISNSSGKPVSTHEERVFNQ